MYKLIFDLVSQSCSSVFKTNEDGTISSIPFDPANTDYQAYLKWLEEGNVPLPANEPPVDEPPAVEPLAVEPLPADEPPVDEPPADEVVE